MNYSLDHKLLEDDYILTLKGSVRHISWVALCQIVHFTKHSKDKHYCDFRVRAMAEAWNCKAGTIKIALEGLMEAGLIKRTRLYQRNGKIPARYVALKYVNNRIPKGTKLHPLGHKAASPRDKVNNYNNYKYNDNDFYQSSSSNSSKEVDPLEQLMKEELNKQKPKK